MEGRETEDRKRVDEPLAAAGAAAGATAALAAASPAPAGDAGHPAQRLPGWARELVRFATLMVAVSMVTFALVGMSPIDPVQMNVGQASYARMSSEKREQLREYWGVDASRKQ